MSPRGPAHLRRARWLPPEALRNASQKSDLQLVAVFSTSGKKGRLGKNSPVLGSLLFTKLELDVMARARVPVHERRLFAVYADELQNLAGQTSPPSSPRPENMGSQIIKRNPGHQYAVGIATGDVSGLPELAQPKVCSSNRTSRNEFGNLAAMSSTWTANRRPHLLLRRSLAHRQGVR